MVVGRPPRCGIENDDVAAWNAETLPDKSVSEDERR